MWREISTFASEDIRDKDSSFYYSHEILPWIIQKQMAASPHLSGGVGFGGIAFWMGLVGQVPWECVVPQPNDPRPPFSIILLLILEKRRNEH